MKRWWRRGILALLLCGAVLLGWRLFVADRVQPASAAQRQAEAAKLRDPALVARGAYLATMGDCAACHTARGSRRYAGGRVLATPFGDVPAPNITPDPDTGIGRWRFADFWRALHQGRGRRGEPLYPVFSYTSFTRVTRDDAWAIFAYLKSLPPVRQPNREPALSFPYNVRSSLLAWRALYFRPGVYRPDPARSAEWNRGAYLVQGLGHCGECHTPRNAWGAMDEKRRLVGGSLPAQDWYAPGLGTQPGGGLAGWSGQDIVDLLKTGESSKGAAFGPMADVVRNSTQYMSEADLRAMATYLRALPARGPAPAPAAFAQATGHAQGGELYAQQCAACH
ncbi:MAG: cytochrome c, partial [Xanthomonadaceae bacterium]|nr:cytochrome c [Xanthomonadaceae bacterium]